MGLANLPTAAMFALAGERLDPSSAAERCYEATGFRPGQHIESRAMVGRANTAIARVH
jgi:hypothetical protein